MDISSVLLSHSVHLKWLKNEFKNTCPREKHEVIIDVSTTQMVNFLRVAILWLLTSPTKCLEKPRKECLDSTLKFSHKLVTKSTAYSKRIHGKAQEGQRFDYSSGKLLHFEGTLLLLTVTNSLSNSIFKGLRLSSSNLQLRIRTFVETFQAERTIILVRIAEKIGWSMDGGAIREIWLY